RTPAPVGMPRRQGPPRRYQRRPPCQLRGRRLRPFHEFRAVRARRDLMRRASDAERERLHATFEALCRIPSPTGEERGCADYLSAELRGLGLEVDEDDAGAVVGSSAGNLYA